MTGPQRLVPVGRVGRPHGRDGSFRVEASAHSLPVGTELTVAGRPALVERRAGTDVRPLIRLSGITQREAAAALRGEALLAPEVAAPPAEGEWLAEDLVGCVIEGLGEVRRVVSAPSCDVLEVGERGVLVPFIAQAIRAVDPVGRSIELDRHFLALDELEDHPSAGSDSASQAPRRMEQDG